MMSDSDSDSDTDSDTDSDFSCTSDNVIDATTASISASAINVDTSTTATTTNVMTESSICLVTPDETKSMLIYTTYMHCMYMYPLHMKITYVQGYNNL